MLLGKTGRQTCKVPRYYVWMDSITGGTQGEWLASPSPPHPYSLLFHPEATQDNTKCYKLTLKDCNRYFHMYLKNATSVS
jgi:hypothetical protein